MVRSPHLSHCCAPPLKFSFCLFFFFLWGCPFLFFFVCVKVLFRSQKRRQQQEGSNLLSSLGSFFSSAKFFLFIYLVYYPTIFAFWSKKRKGKEDTIVTVWIGCLAHRQAAPRRRLKGGVHRRRCKKVVPLAQVVSHQLNGRVATSTPPPLLPPHNRLS